MAELIWSSIFDGEPPERGNFFVYILVEKEKDNEMGPTHQFYISTSIRFGNKWLDIVEDESKKIIAWIPMPKPPEVYWDGKLNKKTG